MRFRLCWRAFVWRTVQSTEGGETLHFARRGLSSIDWPTAFAKHVGNMIGQDQIAESPIICFTTYIHQSNLHPTQNSPLRFHIRTLIVHTSQQGNAVHMPQPGNQKEHNMTIYTCKHKKAKSYADADATTAAT